MPDVDRRLLLRWVALAVTVAVNTVVMWSDAVAAWWAEQVGGDPDGGSVLPAPVRWLFESRPDLGDAELHALAWALAAFLAAMAVGRARVRCGLGGAALSVWAWSVTVEALQPVVSTSRGFEWVDVAGNTVGVVAGTLVASWWRGRTRASESTRRSR
ncbi:MAG: hypothetical protein WD225_10380 [Ilumatobacteraceae bacterium]